MAQWLPATALATMLLRMRLVRLPPQQYKSVVTLTLVLSTPQVVPLVVLVWARVSTAQGAVAVVVPVWVLHMPRGAA